MKRLAILPLLSLVLAGCGGPPAPDVMPDGAETGLASYSAGKFHGRRTANGEIYDEAAMTAAHRTLPFGTVVQVTHLDNGRTVKVRINDRGPWKKGRVIDLSRAAAAELGMLRQGLARVRIDLRPDPGANPQSNSRTGGG